MKNTVKKKLDKVIVKSSNFRHFSLSNYAYDFSFSGTYRLGNRHVNPRTGRPFLITRTGRAGGSFDLITLIDRGLIRRVVELCEKKHCCRRFLGDSQRYYFYYDY